METNEDVKKELFLCLKAVIQHLPEKYQEAIQLVEFEGVTQKELAENSKVAYVLTTVGGFFRLTVC